MRAFTLIAAASAATLAASPAAPADPLVDFADGQAAARLERIYFARVSAMELRARVASNGCTDESSFDVEVERVTGDNGEAAYEVALVRKAPDTCRRPRRNGVYVSYPLESLGIAAGAAVTVANPVVRYRG